jgi:hypothetical protein
VDAPARRSEKTVVILQSNYIPWKGYFDLIRMADEFIIYDDAQYTHGDWRNRNKIRTASGSSWLTIPVVKKSGHLRPIREVEIADRSWTRAHWRTIYYNYARARYMSTYREWLEELYLGCEERMLSQVNFRFLRAIFDLLGIHPKVTWSMDYQLIPGKSERVADLCVQAGATRYVSGPAAREYIDESDFVKAGVELVWMDYSGYPEYRQLHSPFDHRVSIIDLILNEGPGANAFMKSPEDIAVPRSTAPDRSL